MHDLHLVRNTPGGDDDYGANGVFIEANNIKVLHNRFENCIAPSYDYGTDGGTIEIWSNCSNIEIAYNFSKRNNGFMEIGGRAGDSVSSITVHHNLIVNDIVIFSPHLSGTFGITLSDIKYENNTVIVTENNYGYALFITSGDTITSAKLSVKNNIFYTVYPNRVFNMGSGSTFIHQYNLYNQIASKISYTSGDFTAGTGEISGGDAGFINLVSEDLHLRNGSDPVNAGTDLGYSVDYDDATVPFSSGVEDIGCFESSF